MSGAIRKTGSIRKVVIVTSLAALAVLFLSSIKVIELPGSRRVLSLQKTNVGYSFSDNSVLNQKSPENDSVLTSDPSKSAEVASLPIDGAEATSDTKTTAPPTDEVPLINGKPFELAFLIPLTSTHFNFCRSLYTALINDYPKPTLINWGKVYSTAPEARVRKINGLDEFLHTLQPHQYALIMDGFDVWYQLPYKDLVQHYLELTEKDKYGVAVFGADKKCWPNAVNSPACVNIPQSTLPKDAYGPFTDNGKAVAKPRMVYPYNRPRWLNSGNMLGPVSVLQQVYDRANYSISHAPPEEVYSDQMYIAEVFGQQDLAMAIDYKSDLFQTMTFSHNDVIFVDDDVFASPRKDPKDRRRLAFNKISGALPPVLHFNGPKNAMDEWWPKMWWHQERLKPEIVEKSKKIFEEGGAYTVTGEFISWTDLCGSDIDLSHVPKGVTPYS